MLVCSLYAVAVQGKTHKEVFGMIFFICRDLRNCLWNAWTYYLTYETVNYSSNSIKNNLGLIFWKKVDAESLRPLPKYQVNVKIQLKTVRVLGYLSVSYDNGYHLYVTLMYSYVIRMWLVSTRMPSVCHSYVVLLWTCSHTTLPHLQDGIANSEKAYSVINACLMTHRKNKLN